jgi:predicted dehydrogenase
MQLGVIGLGQRWRTRYRPALHALRDQFHVSLVCDQVQQRAQHEARSLGCEAALGPTELLQSSAVEAVLLLDAQWFGLWPLQLACQLGKPVFCDDDLLVDETDLDSLLQRVRDTSLPVLVGMTSRHAPATAVLRELLGGGLGPARGLTCDFFLSPQLAGPGTVTGRRDLSVPLSLLDLCSQLFEAEPLRIAASGTASGDFTGALLEFPDDRRAQLTGWRSAEVWHAPCLRVVAERGWALVELPGRLRWTDAEGRHCYVPRGLPAPDEVLLDRFFHAVCSGQPPRPNLDEAGRVLGWLRAAERSRAEGIPVVLGG